MDKLSFDVLIREHVYELNHKPKVYVGDITFTTSVSDWRSRLGQAKIAANVTGYDKNRKTKHLSASFTIASFISLTQPNAIFNVNKSLLFIDELNMLLDSDCVRWQIKIVIHDIVFLNDERVDIWLDIK